MKNINVNEIRENVFKLIGEDWMLITAGTKESFNTMTAAWGNMGILWSIPVAIIYVRPTRYTYDFLEKNTFFSLCFFEEKYRYILDFCGNNSGRDVDKIKETGLTPVFIDNDKVYFQQAKLILICKKIYYDDIKPEFFLDNRISSKYPLKDYHRFYIGEICLSFLNE